jgi:RNA polymerase primary sigma factor
MSIRCNVICANVIRKGGRINYCLSVRWCNMTNEEFVEKIQQGANQRSNMQLLYEQNMGFINSVIKRYNYISRVQNPYKEVPIIEFSELQQEAFIGLCNAVKGYDASMGCTFLTYAEPWIKQTVRRFIDNCGNTIRVPAYMQLLINRYNKIQNHFMSKYGRNADATEIADILCLSVKDIEKLETFMFQSSKPISLDAPLTADDNTDLTMSESIYDDSVDIEEEVIEKVVKDEVSEIWNEVSRVLKNPVMADIILYRFRDNMTLKEIADIIGIKAESARNYETKALRRLRSDSKTKRLFSMIA